MKKQGLQNIELFIFVACVLDPDSANEDLFLVQADLILSGSECFLWIQKCRECCSTAGSLLYLEPQLCCVVLL